jgi:tryptophan halogenase
MPLPPDGQMPPYTRATALSAGWAWKIPLSRRLGFGYVYSSRFTSREQATAELLAHAGPAAKDAQPGHLSMRVGRREHFWAANCVSIGLAAGFLEPLESTGIFLVQKGIELLLDHFPDSGCNPALAGAYNARMAAEFEHVRDFIVLHYLLSERDDSDFWIENRRAAPPDSLAATLEHYDRTGLVDWSGASLFKDVSFHCIASGFDRLPQAYHAMADQVDVERAWQGMQRIKAQNLALARSLPDHGSLIRAVNEGRKPLGA